MIGGGVSLRMKSGQEQLVGVPLHREDIRKESHCVSKTCNDMGQRCSTIATENFGRNLTGWMVFSQKNSIDPQIYSKNAPPNPPPNQWGFSCFNVLLFFLIFGVFCLSFAFLPQFMLHPQAWKLPTQWGYWQIFIGRKMISGMIWIPARRFVTGKIIAWNDLVL